MRGHFGIGIYVPKNQPNLGTLWRSAHSFGASYIFTIGARYRIQASDTTHAWKHIPMYSYATWDDFRQCLPEGVRVIGVERPGRDLAKFVHPERAVYVLGAEDFGLPPELYGIDARVEIRTASPYCLNVATAGSIVLYDRMMKNG